MVLRLRMSGIARANQKRTRQAVLTVVCETCWYGCCKTLDVLVQTTNKALDRNTTVVARPNGGKIFLKRLYVIAPIAPAEYLLGILLLD